MLHGPLVLLLMYCYIWNKFSLNQGELWQNAPYPSCFYVCKHTIPDAYTPSCIQFCLFSILHANDEYAVILRVNSARLNLKEATEGQQQQQKRICWPCCQETANNCHWCNIVGIMQWWAFVLLFIFACLPLCFVHLLCFVFVVFLASISKMFYSRRCRGQKALPCDLSAARLAAEGRALCTVDGLSQSAKWLRSITDTNICLLRHPFPFYLSTLTHVSWISCL